jgi:hypothetical protein
MTDVIVKMPDGSFVHYCIGDDYPAIAYVRPGGTLRVKRADLSYEKELLRKIRV